MLNLQVLVHPYNLQKTCLTIVKGMQRASFLFSLDFHLFNLHSCTNTASPELPLLFPVRQKNIEKVNNISRQTISTVFFIGALRQAFFMDSPLDDRKVVVKG